MNFYLPKIHPPIILFPPVFRMVYKHIFSKTAHKNHNDELKLKLKDNYDFSGRFLCWRPTLFLSFFGFATPYTLTLSKTTHQNKVLLKWCLLTKTLTSCKEILVKIGLKLEDNRFFHKDLFSEDSPTYHLFFSPFSLMVYSHICTKTVH